MPIIGHVGRRSWKVRLLNITIHLVLIAGGASMIYPFLIMLSGSVKSQLDFKYFNIIPRYFSDEKVLFQKYLSTKYNERLQFAQECLNEHLSEFEEFEPPENLSAQRVEDWETFLDSAPERMDHYFYGLGAISESGVQPEMRRAIKNWLKRMYKGDLDRMNEELSMQLTSWEGVAFPPENFVERRATGDYQGHLALYREFKEKESPRLYHYYFSLDGVFQGKLRRKFKDKIEVLNSALQLDRKGWKDMHLSRRKPEGPIGELWEKFVRRDLNRQFIQVSEKATRNYRQFLADKYRQDLGFFNKTYKTNYSSFDEIPFVREVPSRGIVLSDWQDYVESHVPVEYLSIRSAEFYYRDFLKDKYTTLEALNQVHDSEYKSFDTVNIPAKEWEWTLFQENKRHILWEFIKRNYVVVIDTILFNGSSILNTVIYCSLSILAALLVNPLAAYALSRYKPPSTFKLLLLLMLTMAFPPMVLGIPQFLLIKQMGLLNTYAALILPGMANGYMIFLLKGFFDSLPQELFECATIDGAKEWTMFWTIAMSLSKPILAVIALGAFVSAYGNFMLAFILCQDERMWTIMVHLYQLRQYSNQAVVFASLVIAAIPTFLVFVFCQNIIIRGIVVPTEK